MATPRKKVKVDPLYPHLGKIMKGIRKGKGLTQTQIAEEIGSVGAAICSYETGRARMPLAVFIRWCVAMDVGPGDLMNQMALDLMISRLPETIDNEEGVQDE